MGFTSLWFLLFLIVLIPTYYLVKKEYRWIALLVASVVFYALCSYKSIVFLLFTTVSIYIFSLLIDKNKKKEKECIEKGLEVEEKKQLKKKNKKIRKTYLILGIVSIVLVLAMMKYMNFMIDNVNLLSSLFNSSIEIKRVNWILPLGISFYTFQAIGYLVDVYWGKYEPERNFFKFSLFMIFFPKIMQGPIIRYNEIHDTLFLGNDFNYDNFTSGLKRMAWGYFKKLVIADCFIVVTTYAFSSFELLYPIEAILAIIIYFAYDYCDFSGYMDISIGTSLCLGVEMSENFNHPYFAQSIDEYWRRWHMSLGTWFKDYLFYPLSVSKVFLKIGKKTKKIFGGFAKKIPGILGLLIVWFTTGLWHGASWNYILWGLYFGLIIILSIIFEPLYNKLYTKIDRENIFLRIFRHIRTIILLAFGKVLFEMNSIDSTFAYFGQIFKTKEFFELDTLIDTVGLPSLIVSACASIIVLVVDIIQEARPQTSFITKTKKLPLGIQWTMFIALTIMIIWFGWYGSGLPRFEFGYMQF